MEDKALKPAIEQAFGAKTYSYKMKDRTWLFLENKHDNIKVIPITRYGNNLLAALHYEQLGFSVIPVKAKIISPTKIKKRTLVKWKPYQTTRATPEQIKEWWSQWPDALIGVICGKISGIIAIDTDTKEADEEFQSLLPEGLEVPTCSTPRGGRHYIFQYEERVKNLKGSFEVQSDGAIIILPPSKISDGRSYEWMSCGL